jgi:short-subunit dehydrogenase
MATQADRPSGSSTHSDSVHPFAVVTGASSGIGYEIAKQLGERGYDLLIVAENNDIHTAARQISATGARAEALQADLAGADGVHQMLDRIQASGRPLDVLVLNAGVGVGGSFLETDLNAELNLIRLNVLSVVHASKHLLPRMVANGSGRVLYTASMASELPAPFMAVYGASKAFVLSFAQAIRNELKDTGVTITALEPGPTETNFFARADMLDTRVGESKKDDPADVARDGLEALFAGDDKAVGGSFMNKVMTTVGNMIPDTMKAESHRKLTEPGSGETNP